MSIGRKIKGIYQLFRVELPFAAGICVIAGELLGIGSHISFYQILLGFLSGFFISSSALIFNDYFDIESDKINTPTRPLPSGKVKPSEVILLTIITTAIGLVAALLISLIGFSVGIVFWIIGFLYNWKLKETGLLGNIMVSCSVAITFIFGGIAVGQPWNKIVWFFSFIVFFIDLGEEIGSGAMDEKGDKKRSSKSIAITKGKDYALRISSGLFTVVIVISFIPFILQWLGIPYLIMIAIMDTIIFLFTIKLLRSKTPKEGRLYLRLIYLGATVSLIAFIIGQLIA
ncbi:Digeranylgeranylglyceryl phosphate synthase [uncultured archaeon]|nr:Digeranylgeranylglyceryl phosphate synthase [uncultured archaeon]